MHVLQGLINRGPRLIHGADEPLVRSAGFFRLPLVWPLHAAADIAGQGCGFGGWTNPELPLQQRAKFHVLLERPRPLAGEHQQAQHLAMHRFPKRIFSQNLQPIIERLGKAFAAQPAGLTVLQHHSEWRLWRQAHGYPP